MESAGLRHRRKGRRERSNIATLPSEGDHLNLHDPEEKSTTNGLHFKFPTCLVVLLVPRLLAAYFSPVADCDETFNYWEPVHFMLFGFGQQTWEYSPVYALRSYAYLLPHALVVRVGMVISGLAGGGDAEHKIFAWYFLRAGLAVASAVCEAVFIQGTAKRYGKVVAGYALAFLTFGSGPFFSAVAFVPSSVCMYLVYIGYGSLLLGNDAAAFVAAQASVLIAWPFSCLAFAPMLPALLQRRGLLWFLRLGFGFTAALLTWSVAVDVRIRKDVIVYYRRIIVASLNIALYNVFGGKGPELYGVEPWTFYVKNLILNFNIAFPLAIMSLPLLALQGILNGIFHGSRAGGRRREGSPASRVSSLCFVLWDYSIALLPFFVWLGLFLRIPHKEERFLFPAYPSLALCAAATMKAVERRTEATVAAIMGSGGRDERRETKVPTRLFTIILRVVTLTSFAVLSISRTVLVSSSYSAPLNTWEALSRDISTERATAQWGDNHTRVCVGREWYRYPSSFFLPAHARLSYVESGFGGLLPRAFLESPGMRDRAGARAVPPHMNDENREERERYVQASTCDYYVDVDIEALDAGEGEKGCLAKAGFEPSRWHALDSFPFLLNDRSPASTRAFYVPFLSQTRNTMARYTVYKKVNEDAT